MRLPLRTRILLITIVPIVTLVFGTLALVNRGVTGQVQEGIREDLRRSSAVVENVLGARARALAVAGDVIARDPRFFSVLTLPGADGDAQVRGTVTGVARDFNLLVQADLFEVLDARGHLLASVGREASSEHGRLPLAARALAGRAAAGILVTGSSMFQAQASPVMVGGRLMGALLLGTRLDDRLAADLRGLTRSEVTFVCGPVTTGTTLESDEERATALAAAWALTSGHRAMPTHGTVAEVAMPAHVAVTLVQALPGAEPGRRLLFLMQRSLDAETAFLRSVQAGLMTLAAVALLLALLAGALIAHRIIGPVRRLVRGAEEMERGNYDFPLGVRSGDEIGYLAQRFEDMREKERSYVTSLEDLARVKSEFIAVASHELRTPISILTGYQELMSIGALGVITPEQRDALEGMRSSVETLTRIAQDATRMTQIQGAQLVLKREWHELEGLLRDAVRAAEADAPGRRVRVSIEAAGGLGSAAVDGPRLAQAVANLVRNGIRFTPDGGTVVVRACRDATALEIAVSDTGVGIPRERQPYVFERAFMVRDSHHHHSSGTLAFGSAGVGLGLSIAHGIVQAHGGSIVVESEPGRGSTFTILLPLEAAPVLSEAA